MIARWLKVAFVATVGLFFAVVAFGNVTDYGSNFRFVRHVLSMDTIFPDSTLTWRAVTAPWAHHLFYWVIIFWQVVTALLCLAGAARMVAARRATAGDFQRSKAVAVAGLGAGFLLYALGFLVVGGEWFAMWQSRTWNGQGSAHIFLTMIGLALIYVSMRDEGESPPAR